MNFKRVRRIALMAANLLVWGDLAYSGWTFYRFERAGFDPARFRYYVAFPTIMLLIVLLPPVVLWRTRRAILGSVWLMLTLLAVLPYIFFYTGGM